MTHRRPSLRRISLLLAGSLFTGLPLAQAHVGMSPPVDHALVAGFDRFFKAGDDDARLAEGGAHLLNELNCVACHAAPKEWQEVLPGRAKLDLSAVGNRLSTDDIRAFIQNPQHVKKGTIMPGLFAGSANDDKAVAALTSYLSSLKKGEIKKYPAGDAKHGRELYHTVGCIACHDPAKVAEYRPAEAPEGMEVAKLTFPSVPLALGERYDRDALAAFLQDPLAVRHSGRMPSTELTDQEAADIAAYLQADRASDQPAALATTPDAIAEGRKVFAAQSCTTCHDTGEAVSPAKPATALVKLQSDKGCLSKTKKTGVPDFTLSELQQKAIALALTAIRQAPVAQTASQKVDAHLLRMNCYSCHQWNDKGGAEAGRAQYLTVKDAMAHSLGEIGLLPPKLKGVGRKITKGWMEKLLWGTGGGVRPYMTSRMPRFGKENVENLIPELAEASKTDNPMQMDTSGLLKHHRGELGRVLMGVGTGGLGCVSCHGLKDRKSLGVPVVNLTHTVERLQPGYFKELLVNPQATQPGTLMPPLFMGRKNANLEFEQIWTYLKELDQSRLPEGLLQTGDYELKPAAAGHPVIFRTFLEGAGTQAVAVGYPAGLNVAFDSYEVHWALAWSGRYLDAMTTWEERAMTPIKPLGEKAVTLSARMPFAKLKSTGDAWPEAIGAEAGYHFKGYRVTKDGNPVFLYEVDNLKIEDSLKPSADGKSLIRTVTVSGEGDGWYFQGALSDASPASVVWKDGKAVFEETLQF